MTTLELISNDFGYYLIKSWLIGLLVGYGIKAIFLMFKKGTSQ